MTPRTNLTELGLEKHIADFFTDAENGNKFILRDKSEYNRKDCIDEDMLFEFLEATQPKELEKLKEIHLDQYRSKIIYRLNQKIKENTVVQGIYTGGIINVLRKGIDDNNVKLKLFFDKPNSNLNPEDQLLFDKNIFSITRQVHYSLENENSLDLVIFINGLPVITFELKNELTKQTVRDAINQYKRDRSPKEELFRLGRCLVHFAVDTEQVWMTTHINGESTTFLPFNRGYNNGAGNPDNGGIKTDYLWKEILTKSSLTNIVQNFVQFFEEESEKLKSDGSFETVKKKILIFPRYHQLNVVNRLLDDAKRNGLGHKYLIQHSAGSGKSNSISWLAHQLINLYDSSATKNVFDTVVVVTDRIVLDTQTRLNIKKFEQVAGVVEAITEGSRQLKDALFDGKKIIISTIQKFPVIVGDMADLPHLKFAVIIDEAHSSTSGSALRSLNESLYNELVNEAEEDERTIEDDEADGNDALLQLIARSRQLLSNASYFAFTATPKNKTLELFGLPFSEDGVTKYRAYDLSSMKQAIQENFIMDVLKNYTTYGSFYNLYKKIDEDPQFDKSKAHKKLKKYVESHPTSITKKTAIMINHFIENVARTNKIKGMAKAMLVTSSRANAVQYKHAFDAYIAENLIPFKTIVAFSGKIDDQTESSLNQFPSSQIPKMFNKKEFKILIVANKFQTGFDQPLLHTMYVDKKLGGVNAVQTLSRLNRTASGKDDTFVLDFANDAESIKKSFDPYFESTHLGEKTDPNKLFDLQSALDLYNIYSQSQVNDFVTKILKGARLDEVHGLLNTTVEAFKNDLDQVSQDDFRDKCKSFVKLYVFLSQIIPFTNAYLESLYLFLNHLQNKLTKPAEVDLSAGILDTIDLDSLKYRFLTNDSIYLDAGKELAPMPTTMVGGVAEPELDHLSNIIKKFNETYGTEFSDDDKIRQISENLIKDVALNEKFEDAVTHTPSTARITFEQVFDKKFIDLINYNMDFYKLVNEDKEKKDFYTDFLFNILMSNFKKYSKEVS